MTDAIVIAGATGDLAKRKLLPALAHLCKSGALPNSIIIVGTGRRPLSDDAFRLLAGESGILSSRMYYHQGIAGLDSFLRKKGSTHKVALFCALPPNAYASTAEEFAADGIATRGRLIIEKPFGYDSESSQALNDSLLRFFPEEEIYRIDHYLAKEAVQNILVFRFANSLFEPLWNTDSIDTIQISATETIGVLGRGPYFDTAGIIRDMVQNHLTQLVCLIMMNRPQSLDPVHIRKEKMAILESLSIVKYATGQYLGYTEEPGVPSDSTTETYAEIELASSLARWKSTRILIRSGKALPTHATEIGITFRPVALPLFPVEAKSAHNSIIFKIQPSEGIVLDMSTKVPGGELALADTAMAFCYRDAFSSEIPEAYQRLLLDAIKGDKTLFVSSVQTQASWNLYGPILGKPAQYLYKKGECPCLNSFTGWLDFEKYRSICT